MNFRDSYIAGSLKGIWYFVLAIILLLLTVPVLAGMPGASNAQDPELAGVAFIAITGVLACIASFVLLLNRR